MFVLFVWMLLPIPFLAGLAIALQTITGPLGTVELPPFKVLPAVGTTLAAVVEEIEQLHQNSPS